MTAPRTRPGGRSLIGDPADLAAECREIRRLRAQRQAALAVADGFDQLADKGDEVSMAGAASRIRRALGVTDDE